MGEPVRQIDCLCTDCVDEIITTGWGQRAPHVGETSCESCYAQIRRMVHAAGGPLELRPRHPALTQAQRRDLTAHHEAAHAAVVLDRGYTLNSLSLPFNSRVPGREHADGHVHFTPDGDDADGIAAVLMAGQAAEQRYLADRGLTDRATLIDIAHATRGDVAELSRRERGDLNRPVRTGLSQAAASLHNVGDDRLGGLAAALARHESLPPEGVAAHLDPRMPVITPPDEGNDFYDVDLIDAAPQPSPQPQTTSSAALTTTGGSTTMGIDDVRSGIAAAEQRGQTAAQQLAQVREDLQDMTQLLMQITQGSHDGDVAEAVGQLQAVGEDLDQLPGRIHAATSTAAAYAGRL